MDFADDASEVGKQIRAKIWRDQRAPPLGAEDHMQQNIAGCMRQASFAPAGASPFGVIHPRLAPWAAFLRRFAASAGWPGLNLLLTHWGARSSFAWAGPLR